MQDEALTESCLQKCIDENKIGSYEHFSPRHTRGSLGRKKQLFRKFYEPPLNGQRFDIVFHFRDFERKDGAEKNLSRSTGAEIVRWATHSGFSVACIGDPDLSYCPPYAVDRRSRNLRDTVSAICSAKLVVGGSSGPMHLSSLCDVPIMVWIGPSADIQRYLSYWNPFRSRVYVLTDKTFKPPADVVVKRITSIFNEEPLTWKEGESPMNKSRVGL
jgi:hypothetical protein